MVRRSGTLASFFAAQLLVQLVGFLSGLLIVRSLDKQAYGIFTLANTYQGAMNTLADVGVSVGLSSIGGRVWNDRPSFSSLIRTAMDLRFGLARAVVAVVAPVLVWNLVRTGVSPVTVAGVVVVVLFELMFYLAVTVRSSIPLLQGRASQLRSVNLAGSAMRLGLLALLALTDLNVVGALACSAFASALQWWLIARMTRHAVSRDAQADPVMRREILALVRLNYPNVVYYVLSGQVTVLLLSMLGSAERVAEVGALGRLGAVFAAVSATLNAIVVPSFAKARTHADLRVRYVVTVTGMVVLSISFVALSLVFGDQLLWLLGPNYGALRSELVFSVLGVGMASVTGAIHALNSSRAWILPPAINIGASVGAQAIALLILDMSTVRGAILFGLFPLLVALPLNAGLSYLRLRGHESP